MSQVTLTQPEPGNMSWNEWDHVGMSQSELNQVRTSQRELKQFRTSESELKQFRTSNVISYQLEYWLVTVHTHSDSHSAVPLEHQATSTMTRYSTAPHYPDTVLASPCPIPLMLRVRPGSKSINFISQWFDQAGIWTTDFPHDMLALYSFGYRVRFFIKYLNPFSHSNATQSSSVPLIPLPESTLPLMFYDK